MRSFELARVTCITGVSGVSTDHEELLLVDAVISVRVEHVEGDAEPGQRLCNTRPIEPPTRFTAQIKELCREVSAALTGFQASLSVFTRSFVYKVACRQLEHSAQYDSTITFDVSCWGTDKFHWDWGGGGGGGHVT